jgi:diaminopimelate decarboxylase
MKINEVETRVGITKKNIRFYEEKGLVSPKRNDTNGYREYSEEDVEILQKVKLLRQLSVPIEEILKLENITLCGFHCHVGSQVFDSEVFCDAAKIMLSFIKDIDDTLGYKAEYLNLGGGFGVRYTEDDPEIDYAANIKALGEEFDSICRDLQIPKPSIMMEPGRSIVAAAGATLYTVGSVKEVIGFRNYVSVDGGMPDNPRYTLYGSRYTVLNADKADAPADYACTLAGRCCESGDLLAEGISIAKPERGSHIAVLVTGAYNYSMASNYNRIPRPPMIFIEQGSASVAVRRETYDDLVALDQ